MPKIWLGRAVRTVCVALSLASWFQASAMAEMCERRVFATVGGRVVWRIEIGSALVYSAGLAIDADGAPTAYHSEDKGLDYLANAGRPGNWWGLVTDNGAPSGRPIIQKENDSAPGYYVSTTALQDTAKPRTSPARYLDSRTVPYVSVPRPILRSTHSDGIRVGDVAAVTYGEGRTAFAIVGDIGPANKLGEGSIALAKILGIPSNPRSGGVPSGVAYALFPGSGRGTPLARHEVIDKGGDLLSRLGGWRKLGACASEQ
jgi:hypothetical protein